MKKSIKRKCGVVGVVTLGSHWLKPDGREMKEATSDGEGERMNLLRPGMADGHIFHAVGQQVKR